MLFIAVMTLRLANLRIDKELLKIASIISLMVTPFIKQELLNHGFTIKKNKQSMVIKEKEDIKRMKGWHVSNKEYCIT